MSKLRLPKLYYISMLLIVCSYVLLKFTSIHFMLVLFPAGILLIPANVWLHVYYRNRLTMTLYDEDLEVYHSVKFKGRTNNYKGKAIVSASELLKLETFDKMNEPIQYFARKVIESRNNLFFSFFLLFILIIGISL